jgi:ATP-binding cassette subfamily G (WHITE) protein 2 (SNQ2)
MAARLAAILITAMILYGGYLIPVFSMKRWLFWIYYINPLNYCFSAAMINEFRNIDLVCTGNFISPRNIGNITKYPVELGANQVCTLVGSTPGNPIVTGNEYLFANFEYLPNELWRNFGITIAFFLFFLAIQMYAAERAGAAPQSPVS